MLLPSSTREKGIQWSLFKANPKGLSNILFLTGVCINQINGVIITSHVQVHSYIKYLFKMVESVLLGMLKDLAMSVLLLVPALTASNTAILFARCMALCLDIMIQ